MRVAVIADIHGNLLALEAVLADLKGRGADLVVDLGDCASGPLWPRETMERLHGLEALTVRGNTTGRSQSSRPRKWGLRTVSPLVSLPRSSASFWASCR